ncbi:farnesyl-diphosphate synthase [Roridomyces roridus]|uniref:(2E,6E)-farnesyl diphosphate synthase n=1 Tax=Roridomyces roridus TaxID=1738132 RepID=A0AAD7C425_9AGAR|nr:farnesyl-diphosphate synthase [Roridomyces roridus]
MADKAAKRAKFEAAWDRIRQELVSGIADEGMPKDAIDWFGKNLDYNVPGGKLNRGLSVVDTAEILKGSTLDDDEYYKAAILGWGVELLQAFFLVSDDIMDSSITRRGQPCYYRAPGIGMIAINDSFMLEGAIYYLLKKHFRSTPYYVDLLELFHDTTYQTEMGQLIDLITAPEDHVDLDKFSLKKHSLIVIYKTAYYSFYLPVALAMYMNGVPQSYTLEGKTVEPYKAALSILIPLGEYFQIQDDFLDFSAPPEVLGKIGTDILDNKCSWVINTALAVVTPDQRAVLDANYGRKDSAAEARVKEVFEAVGIRERYAKYEAEVYEKLNGLIAAIPEGPERGTIKREIFTSFLEKIYKRSK